MNLAIILIISLALCITETYGLRKLTFLSMNIFKDIKKNLVSSLAGEYNVDKISSQLEGYRNRSGVTMLSFENCPFCVRAREVLNEKGVKYEDIMIDKMDENKALRAELGKKYGQTSVPAIFVNGYFVGGCNNGGMGGLIPLVQTGKFDELLKAKQI